VSKKDLDRLLEIIRHLKYVANLESYDAITLSLFKIVRDMLDTLVHQIDKFLADSAKKKVVQS
jgi:hypothetical protein